ncbi:ATP-dependent DNA ligase [Rhizobium cauense]|uniref:ATP-dependent DNA ligase n=1 Tax=Rhizobium cauense TaxID=1166683 RepID=UPI001C6DEF41|nr:ATP-dependent DNA ligase [Rhizobium cauense]MBW9116889.1 ATP-dependent DNA ligase [Rhizobium cauense]
MRYCTSGRFVLLGISAHALNPVLDQLRTRSVEYDGLRRNVVWSRSTLIAEIEYCYWTHVSMLMRAAYKGFRDVQDNADVFEIAR